MLKYIENLLVDWCCIKILRSQEPLYLSDSYIAKPSNSSKNDMKSFHTRYLKKIVVTFVPVTISTQNLLCSK